MGHKRPIPAKLSRKLKAIREHLGLTEEQLIERLGSPAIPLNRGNIKKYEENLREPPIIVLLRYARLTGVPSEVIIDDAVDLELK
jgi:transcriptional regulator with XRE-family HTH domain